MRLRPRSRKQGPSEFLQEVEALWSRGLGRGGNLENTVVLSQDGILNESGLRFADEFVRHKVLDLIGDFSLLGLPFIGHLIADRSGHALHTRLVKQILDHPECWVLLNADQTVSQAGFSPLFPRLKTRNGCCLRPPSHRLVHLRCCCGTGGKVCSAFVRGKSITPGASGLAPGVRIRQGLLLFLLCCFLRRQDSHLPSKCGVIPDEMTILIPRGSRPPRSPRRCSGPLCGSAYPLQRCRHERERRFALDVQTALDQTLDEFLGMHGAVRLTQPDRPLPERSSGIFTPS